ncbi:MAG: hypothetical protein IOD05_17195 [Rhodobacter sp.]|nr:hypothetical protein [Rhodobacter sp.]MCA3499262.1 hypothetical protein [Rhodobacter sp.]MCA3504949.1 hypothetical protein [Rhodobacter sp.]MCA3517039.1 hypothetical protein [Rhodobacter sp.]
MGDVGSLLAPEVDPGIAVPAAGAWHGVGLGFGRFRVIPGGGIGTGRAARAVIGRPVPGLGLEALYRGACQGA